MNSPEILSKVSTKTDSTKQVLHRVIRSIFNNDSLILRHGNLSYEYGITLLIDTTEIVLFERLANFQLYEFTSAEEARKYYSQIENSIRKMHEGHELDSGERTIYGITKGGAGFIRVKHFILWFSTSCSDSQSYLKKMNNELKTLKQKYKEEFQSAKWECGWTYPEFE